MSYYDKYIKYKKKYLSFANKISGGAESGVESGAESVAENGAESKEGKQEGELQLDKFLESVKNPGFRNLDVGDFMNYLMSVHNDIPENTQKLVDILNDINSVVNYSSAATFTISNLNDMNNDMNTATNSVNNNQLYKLTLALNNYYRKILFIQGIIENEASLITNIINQLITPNTYSNLTTEEKYLLGGLRSLYNKLNERLPTKPTPEPPSKSTPESTSNPPPSSSS